MVRFQTHACTDVTGFGLMGHGTELAQASGVCLCLQASCIPILPEALALAKDGILPAGTYRNRNFAERGVDAGNTERALTDLLFDPQTSGGLLIAVDPQDADQMEAELQKAVPEAKRIGTVEAKTDDHDIKIM